MKRTIYIAGMLIGLCACQSDEPMPDGAADRRVYLAAEVENAHVQSRVPYMLTAPSLNNPLKVDVWASTTGKFVHTEGADGSNGTVEKHTTARFTHGEEQLLDDVIYPKENEVSFVGMHPQDNWSTTDGTSATYTFDGKDDVMFAPQVSGKYAENVDVWPTLTFKHLLTWLKIEMVADNEAVSNAWGKVKNITIKSANQVAIDLSKTFVDKKHDGEGATVTFSGSADMNFYQPDTDTKFPTNEGYTLKGPLTAGADIEGYIEEVAYVLCAPVYASASDEDYTIVVTTEKRTMEIAVDLQKGANQPFAENTMGHQFTLLLRFKVGDNISVSAVAVDWKNGGMGTADFGEEDIKQ